MASNSTWRRLRYPLGAAALFALGWGASTVASESPLLAPARLVVAVVATVLLPGHAVIRTLGWFSGASRRRELLPLSFGVGYGVVTILCALSTFFQLSLTQAFLCLAVSTILFALAPRTSPDGPRQAAERKGPSFALALAIGVVVGCGWVIEARITGEETAELISIRKIAQSPFLSLDGIMPEPGVTPTYVIAPYYFFVALVSKVSGLSIFAAYLKLRAVYAGLALLVFSALASRLLREDRRGVDAITLGLVALFVADPDPWSWPASLFPLVRRGAFTAGVVAPIFMLATHVFVTRSTSESRSRGEWAAPGLLLLPILTTHAMEILYAGFFAVAVVIAGRLTPARSIDWKRVAVFAASAGVAAVAFKVIHSRLAAHVYAFDASARLEILAGLRAEFAEGPKSFVGISSAGKYLLSASGAVVPYTILGILLTPVLIRWRPVAGAVLWAGTVIPLAVYCSSKLLALLQLVTSSEIVFVFGYFTLLGSMSFLATVFVAVSALSARLPPWSGRRDGGLRAAALTLGAIAVGYGAAVVLRTVLPTLLDYPLGVFWVATIAGIAAMSWRRGSLRVGADLAQVPWSAVVLFIAWTLGCGWGLKGTGKIGGARQPLPQTLARAWDSPSVLDWPAYYPVLQASANPTIDLPASIVDDLERLLPPLQTLIADPAHSYSLPVVLNQHIVNPGHRISTSLEYFEQYTREENGQRTHPIFNTSDVLSAEERRFLRRFRVQYVLANPHYATAVRAKLSAEPSAFTLIYERTGFLLFRVNENQGGL